MTLEERVTRLEELYDRLYHTEELLAIYIPKLADITTKYMQANSVYRWDVLSDLKKFQDIIGKFMDDLQAHYKFHFDEVKRREEYASKRKPKYK